MDLVYSGIPAVRDLVYAIRVLRRAPLFTLTAALSLAIGIAGNAAIFSLADALLLRKRPGIADPASLVDVGRTTRGQGFDNMSYPNFADLRERATVFSGMAAYRIGGEPMGLGTGAGAERVYGQPVSSNYFDVLGVPMRLGRGFLVDEDRPGAPQFVAVLSHHLWRDRFESGRDIIGRTIRLNGRVFTIAGIAAEGFTGNTVVRSDLWIPLSAYPLTMGRTPNLLTTRRSGWLVAVGRLRPGAAIEQAVAQVTAIGTDLQRAYPRENEDWSFAALPSHRLPGEIRKYVAAFVGFLFALVGLVLAIACVNVAGMLLARSVARSREMALRLAVGAGRARIIRQLAVESVVLSTASALLGIGLAVALVRVLRGFLPVLPLAVALDIRLDWGVVAFSTAISIVAGLLFGLVPAVQAAKTDLLSAMKADSRGGTRRPGLQSAFVVAQIAMSLLLVVTALLLVRSLRNAGSISPGFETADVEVATIDFRLAGYTRETGLVAQSEILARIEQQPAVRSAAYAAVVPLTGNSMGMGPLKVPGRSEDIPADWNVISPRYFETMRSGMVRGRIFGTGDGPNAPAVAIVNETFAKRVWPGEDAIGKTIDHEDDDARRVLHVVGVARDTKQGSLGAEVRSFIYVPLAQNYLADLSLLVKTDGTRRLTRDLYAVVRQVDPNLPIVYSATLAETTAVGLMPHRLAASVAGAFGSIGLLLAAIGLYGITAYGVNQRTREIGVRVAVGARRNDVLGLIIGQAMRLALAGAAIGLALAAAATRVLGTFLYGVRPLDPSSFGAGVLFFITLALLASWIPARRAAALNPVEVLRAE